MTVFVVGRAFEGSDDWELVGIFTEEPDAIAACTDSLMAVVPMELNRDYRDAEEITVIHPGSAERIRTALKSRDENGVPTYERADAAV